MGFSVHAAEKALFMNQKNQSVEVAMDWLTQHMDDADLNEQLLIVGQTGEGAIKKEYQGGLSKEERIKIAEQKIIEGRKRRAEEEKLNKIEAEKQQRFANKEMAIAKRKLEEKE